MKSNESNLIVAVWMVTFNHELYIEQAVRSVLMQEANFDIKLFIGEDCSTDATRKICQDYQTRYPDQIELILNPTNIGPKPNAFQVYQVCLESGAKYIALLEGDDYWTDPLKLQKQVDYLEAHPQYTFSFTRFSALRVGTPLVDENKRFFKNDQPVIFDFDMFTKGWYSGTLTLMFRTSDMDLKRLQTYRYFRDIHLYTELLKRGNGICLNFNSAVYRIHQHGQHNSLTELEKLQTAVLCYRELRQKNKDVRQLVVKYRYFHSEYIKCLLDTNQPWLALKQNLKFSILITDSFIFKKELKRTVKYFLG